ncbi:MAG TPA: HAMP domain-containing sensor histidine kinase [Candidatus Baltobacteraceae bacterium]|jgi:two-component system sensor histidine kinase CpxA|nr:HAMP domain-containing sensor histidine kinase [Candidatus Baltobacteraceae bacterium]
MPRRFPLSAKIVLWFLLNLVLLAVLFYAVVRAQFRFGPDWLLSSSANDRIDALSGIIVSELAQESPSQWDATLNRFDTGYHDKVRFLVFGPEGRQLAGETVPLPDEIRRRLAPHRGPPRQPGPPPFAAPPEGPPEPPPDFPPKSMIHTVDPSRYWVLVRTSIHVPDQPHPERVVLVAVSDTLGAGGLFFDVAPWVSLGLAALVLSVLLWFPLVRGINRSIAQMTEATRQIAAGRFDARVDEKRLDELGALGRSINQMAGRLAGLVAGQKRFLGDVAHELCSPLAKLRVSLGILEQRAGQEQQTYVARAENEAAHMAALVNELLSFSKASLGAPSAQLRTVNVPETLDKAVRRETSDVAGLQVHVEVQPDLLAIADPELLARAVANLVRNSVRYAGSAGPISVVANLDGDAVRITVADRGPGVPAADLPRIFDPFYRVDASRDRATGGVGLGLAIVKTCVEACGGSVACRNREPSGLEVTIRLDPPRDKEVLK